jgi:hypothetical protein
VGRAGKRRRVEREKTLLGKACQELTCEERIAAGLPVHEFRERPHRRWLSAKRVAKKLAHAVER